MMVSTVMWQVYVVACRGDVPKIVGGQIVAIKKAGDPPAVPVYSDGTFFLAKEDALVVARMLNDDYGLSSWKVYEAQIGLVAAVEA